MAFARFVILPKPNILQYLFNKSLPYRKKCRIRKKIKEFSTTLFSNSNIFSYAEAELFGVLTVRIQFQWNLEYNNYYYLKKVFIRSCLILL